MPHAPTSPSFSDSLGAGAALLTLLLLFCMLIASRTGPGPQRVAVAVAVSPRSRSSLSPSSRRHLFSTPPPPSAPKFTMLQGAVRKHEQKAAQKASSQNIFGRNSSAPSSDQKTPLGPSPPSRSNTQAMAQTTFSHGGVKRTSSGLAKAFNGGAFETSNSNIDGTQAGLFDENDFDSDIELEIDEPITKVAKPTPKYPNLPPHASSKTTSTIKPMMYPTLPKQQSILSAVSTHADSSYGSMESQSQAPPRGTQVLPWSSSPVEHQEPARPNLNKFAYDPFQKPETKPAPAPPQQKSRRKLPWQKDEEKTVSTPYAKESKVSSLWNTTASAVKEQNRRHREDGKKAMKVNEATAEDKAKMKTARARPARVFLSDEQQHVLDLVVEKKKSVFFTGSAGTGKSVLMREIISSLHRKYQREPDRVAVTASTGLAACNVGGVTLHSFAGIGLGKEEVPELVRKIKRNQKAKHRWMRTKVLVIDEVSMVDGELYDKLEQIARQLRNNGRPFGGIQLVITGDFFQLPPVPDSGRAAKFAFDASTWTTTIEHTIGLHHVFRQKDPIFAGMLNEMREGRLSESSVNSFRKLSRDLKFEDALDATELFPTRAEVDRANTQRLAMLQGKEVIFEARDGGSITDKAQRDKLLSNCMAPELITLKKGAQVMLIKNVDESLVNGSLGKVLGFMSEARFDQYHANEEAPPGSLPGSNDIGQALEERAKSRIQGITTAKEYPVVRFQLADGSSRDLLCQPEPWKIEQPNGEVQASRSQVPLILAWALSIHKAQGQTLDRVKVDLGKVFEKGQAYVALSRATSMAGLQVLRFDPRKVNAHDRVRTFYQNLGRVELLEEAEKTKPYKKPTGLGAYDYEQRFVEEEWPEDLR